MQYLTKTYSETKHKCHKNQFLDFDIINHTCSVYLTLKINVMICQQIYQLNKRF